MGCGGRGSVGRAGMFAGRFSVSDRQRVDERRLTPLQKLRSVTHGRLHGLVKEAAYGKSVWFWHPWLVSNRRRFSRAQPGPQNRQFADDGGKRNSSPGRARHKPLNHCAGKAGCSPLDLYARVRTSLCILHTRPRVQRAPGLPCALVWARASVKPRARPAPRDRETVSTVIASEAKQSIATSCTERWIASLRSQ